MKITNKPTRNKQKDKSNEIKYICDAGGMRGVLLLSPMTNSVFLRVYNNKSKNKTFIDYKIVHDDLDIILKAKTMAAVYQRGKEYYIDHSPSVLGYKVNKNKSIKRI